MNKLVKISDLKVHRALVVGNRIICNKIVNKASLRAIVFLNINQKEVLGFQGCADGVVRAAIEPVNPREIAKAIFCHQKMKSNPSCITNNKKYRKIASCELGKNKQAEISQ